MNIEITARYVRRFTLGIVAQGTIVSFATLRNHAVKLSLLQKNRLLEKTVVI